MTKRLTYLAFIFILAVSSAFAKPVSSKTARKVAENFYKINSNIAIQSMTLYHTEYSASGVAVYYVFNINNAEGFVIVTADDVAEPILGYSTEGGYVIPEKGTTIGNWLLKRDEEIEFLQKSNAVAEAKVSSHWATYLNENVSSKLIGNSTASVVAPLVQTKWNQSPFYNAMCPGGSVTGCVATAMAQIMRYWKYPMHGTSQSSYNAGSYGTLSANYGTATYNWANMPLSINTNNSDVALINYHCGVSVEMNYSPSGSGAWVCAADNSVCAENSYKTYFNYDPTTIQGLIRANYDDASWLTIIKGDLDIGRPVQYVGWDPSPSGGGHTWVCDGYDANDFLHMNWGWGGASNGYYSINNMNPSYNFSDGHEAVVGIVPIAANTVDAGIPAVSAPVGYYCNGNFSPSVTLQNFGANSLTSCDINYSIDNGSLQTLNWTGSLVTGQAISVSLPPFVSAAGSHNIVCYSSNPNGASDGDASNDRSATTFNVTLGTILPVMEGFETNSLPSADWNISHGATGNDWTVTSSASATGIKSAMIDNSTNTPNNVSILQTSQYYDLASLSTPVLSFKMAYQKKTSATNERLQVYVSTDCGASWISKWAHWNTTLPNVSGTSTGFAPTPSQFTTYTVNLTSVQTSHNAIFRWVFTSDASSPGNNIYVDDINIASMVTGIQSVESKINLNVYPNPSNGIVHIDLNLSENHNIAVNVTDMLGRSVETVEARNYTGEITLVVDAKKNYEAGVYMVNITVDGQTITKKVIVN